MLIPEKQSGQCRVQRLDRLLSNLKWKMVFDNNVVQHLNKKCSNHAPLVGKLSVAKMKIRVV